MRLLLVGKMSACMRCGKADPRWSVRIGSQKAQPRQRGRTYQRGADLSLRARREARERE